MIEADQIKTRSRRTQIEAYLGAELGDGLKFTCSFYDKCRSSCASNYYYVDQRPHIGDHYDLIIDGNPKRIVVIGRDYGSSDQFVSVEDRTEVIHGCGEYSFGQRNPHMRGTTSILRLLMGKPLGKDSEGEKLGIGDAHLFQGFALVNALMCSAVDRAPDQETGRGSAPSRASGIMFQNCSRHLGAILEILDPTIIVIQGVSGAMLASVSNSLGHAVSFGYNNIRIGTAYIDVFVIPHPSAPHYGWWGGSSRSAYLVNEIVPLLTKICAPSNESQL